MTKLARKDNKKTLNIHSLITHFPQNEQYEARRSGLFFCLPIKNLEIWKFPANFVRSII